MAKRAQHNNNEGKPRVAVYARFSCDKQRDASIEDQIYEAERYCERMGYEIVRVYPDYAISGRSDDRPQFLQMIDDAKKNSFDIVLVWKMDRFARNMQDQFFHEKILNDHGIQLESIKENITGNGIEASLSKGMHAIFAQIRSQQSAEDTMRGMLGKARKCQYLGYQWFGYTHEGDTITLDPVQAPIVEEIHMRYLAGQSIISIIDWLDRAGVKTTRGKKPGYQFVTGILKHWRYTGVYTWGYQKDSRGRKMKDADGQPIPLVRIEGGIPAIVSVDVKERCLKLLQYRKHANAKANYALSGKLHCSKCGAMMHGETCTDSSGKTRWRYTCQGKRHACLGVFWKDKTEAIIANSVRSMLNDSDAIQLIAEKFVEYQRENGQAASIEAARKDLKAIAKQRAHLLKAVEDGLPYKHVRAKFESLELQQKRAERKIAEMEEAADRITKEDVLEFLDLAASGAQTDAEIINAFVRETWVFETEAVAIMNFSKRNSTSKYEVECSLEQYRNAVSSGHSYETAMASPKNGQTNWDNSNFPVLYTHDGVPVALLENGFGVIVSLKKAA